jgi:hypothetical protein
MTDLTDLARFTPCLVDRPPDGAGALAPTARIHIRHTTTTPM